MIQRIICCLPKIKRLGNIKNLTKKGSELKKTNMGTFTGMTMKDIELLLVLTGSYKDLIVKVSKLLKMKRLVKLKSMIKTVLK